MKKFLIQFSILLTCATVFAQAPSVSFTNTVQIPWEQQTATVFQNVNLSTVTTHVLIDRGMPLVPLEYFNSGITDTSKACTVSDWQNIYATLFSAAWQSQFRLPDPQTAYIGVLNSVVETAPIPIPVIAYDYHYINPDAIDDGLFAIQNNQLFDVPNRPRDPYDMGTCFAAAPMLGTVHFLQSQFIFRQDLYFSNNSKTVSQLQVDFDDGLGYRIAQWGSAILVQYPSTGNKFIRTKITYSDNTSLENSARITVTNWTTPVTGRYSQIFQQFHFAGTRQFNGSSGGALITIALGCGNSKLIKPLIVVEGFDPPQEPVSDFFRFRQRLDQVLNDINNNSVILGSDLEGQGYDLVYIDFDNGADYIQRSAYLVEEIIAWVNAQLVANGSAQQNVVLGVSNGGLISRFALRDMEMTGIPHYTRQFISFDSPQQGANFPLGYQFMVSELANAEVYGHNLDLMLPELAKAVEILNNPAARQVLVYHASTFPSEHPERTALMNWFTQNGFPTQCELIGISNGSHYGNGEPFNPNDRLLDMDGNPVQSSTFIIPFIIYEFHVRALPDQNSGVREIFRGIIKTEIGPIEFYHMNTTISVGGTLPYDSAPGGLLSVSGIGLNLSFFGVGTATFHSETFCFVPTVSALDLVSPFNLDLYINVQSLGIIANNRTPFDSYWASIIIFPQLNQLNEPHVFFTGGNIDFFHDVLIGSNSLPVVAGFPMLTGVSYNYGANTIQFTSDHITTGYIIGNGSNISVNANQNLGLPSDNFGPPTPGSQFSVHVGNNGCSTDPVIIEVQANGTLVVGDVSGNRGNLHFTAGSTLRIRNGGKLIVNDNSRLIIEEGAKIIYESGAQILLLGDNAVLDIQGFLELGPNAAFKVTFPNFPSGYVRFSRPSFVPYDPLDPNYQIIVGSDSSMEFIGTNKNDKVLEIAQSSLWIPDALSYFTIDHGRVDFAGNQNQYPSLAVGSPIVTMTWAKFTKRTGTNGGNGVILFGQPNHTIFNCDFVELNAGLTALNFYNIGMLKVSASYFTQCGTGLLVFDKGVDLSACRFNNCGIGASFNGLTFNSKATNCKFNDNTELGIDAKGSPIEFTITDCEAKSNGTAGISAAGLTINLACCDLRNNNIYAIILDYDASLRMSPAFNGGNNNLGNNQIPVTMNEANQVELSGGRNMLKPQGQSCTGNSSNISCPDVFVGTIQTPCTPYVINASNNEWKNNSNNFAFTWNNQQVNDLPLTVAPVTAVGCPSVPVRFSDPAQQSYQQCQNGPNGPPGGGGPPNQMLTPLNSCTNCNSINTESFTNTPTDSAARTAINSMDTSLLTGYSDAVGLFNEILMYPLPNETEEDGYVKKASVRKMHEAFGEGIYRSQIAYSTTILSAEAAEVIQAEADEREKGEESGEYHRRFFAAMREAAAYRTSGKRDIALQKFEEILTWVLPAERPWTEYWVCLTSKELDVLSNQSPKETFIDEVQECMSLRFSTASMRLAGGEEETSGISLNTEVDASVYPNPAAEILTIEIPGAGSGLVTFELYSSTGQLVKSESISGEVQTRIDISDMGAGLYFYRLIGEGDKTKEGRLVIAR